MKPLLKLTVLLVFAVTAGAVSASTITVGQDASYDFTSIQAAINSASAGDVITVADGVYVEGSSTYRGNGNSTGLNFYNHGNISIVGSGTGTVIDLNGSVYGIMLDAVYGVTMSNFSMFNGGSTAVANLNGSGGNLIENAIFGGSFSYGVLDYYNGVTLSNVTWQQVYTPPIATPLPAAAWLLGSGLLGLIGFSRHKKSA